MTSAEIRQSFLDFFARSSTPSCRRRRLMPDSPNLLFTNAGMNQFVPIFLGQTTMPPCDPPRAADTQKCIRAGGKHNDLDDVGLDTYHHTFFEMLGNWSFGDYFKKEAIDWAWELLVERLEISAAAPLRHGLPARTTRRRSERVRPGSVRSLGASYSAPPARSRGPHRQRQQEGQLLDDGRHRPVRPVLANSTSISRPAGDTRGALVNKGDAACIEIWNLVFIQFNANPDGTFSPLPAQHVDTGMGFERVTAIIQGTKNFTDFTGTISNYETDIFRPIFDEIEKLSGKKYGSTLPESRQHRRHRAGKDRRRLPRHRRSHPHAQLRDRRRHPAGQQRPQLRPAPHPAPRRALWPHARFHEPFFYKLVDVLARTMGDVFPELRDNADADRRRTCSRREEEMRSIKHARSKASSSSKPKMVCA